MQSATLAQLRAMFGIYKAQPGNVHLFESHKNWGQRFVNLKVLPDDVWIVSYPRSGAQWIGNIAHLAANDFDYEKANSPPHVEAEIELNSFRVPFGGRLTKDTDIQSELDEDIIKVIEEMPSPRVIKTHLPIQFLPKEIWTVKPKILYVLRNPKDVAVSCHQMIKDLLPGTDFETICQMITDGDMLFGSPCQHILGFWEKRDSLNIHFISFEQMNKDLKSTTRGTLNFLGQFKSEEQLEKLVNFLRSGNIATCLGARLVLSALKEKIKFNNKSQEEEEDDFIKKEQFQDWKSFMNQETSDNFDSWIVKSFKNSNFNLEKFF